jgi:16S rRNA (cytosine1407-C5)-methyltransferase
VNAAKMVKVGGEIVYSTCTTTLEENEYLIDKFLSKYPFEIVHNKIDGLNFENPTGKDIRNNLFHSIRIDPTEADEGFFIIKLKKVDDFSDEKISKSEIVQYYENEIHTFNSSKISEILKQISDNYGIDYNLWENFLFILRSGDIYFTSINDFDYSNLKFLRSGIKLSSLDKKVGWRLTSNAVQILGNKINRNVITLEDKEQLKTYFMGQKTKVSFPDSNFVIVKYKDYYLGSGKVKDSILLSYFPRSRRTIEIDFSLVE